MKKNIDERLSEPMAEWRLFIYFFLFSDFKKVNHAS